MQKLKEHFKQNWWKYLIIIGVLAVDMLTKFLLVPLDANNNVDHSKAITKSLIGELLWLYPSVNDGAGFSILSGKSILLIVLSIIFIILLTIYDVAKPQKSRLYKVSIALIFGGAVGNLIDRLVFTGKVRDFIFFKFINFPVFNVADMALTFGIICMLVWLIFFQNKDKNFQARNDENSDRQNQTGHIQNNNDSNIDKNNGKIDKEKTDNKNANGELV